MRYARRAGHMDKLVAVSTLNALFPRCFSMKQLSIIFEEGCKLVDDAESPPPPPHTWTQSAFVRVRASLLVALRVANARARVAPQYVTILSEKLV